MGLLEVPTPDFEARNVRGDRQERHTAAVGSVEALDQMGIPRPTTPSIYGQAARQMRLGVRSKRRGFLMSHGNLLNIGPPTDRVGDAVEGLPRYAVDSLRSRCHQRLNRQVRHAFLRHRCHRLRLQVLPRGHSFHGAPLRRAAVQERPHMDDLLACACRDPGPPIRVRGIG
jgi:hypothetical protein